jgi:hypothetical protein
MTIKEKLNLMTKTRMANDAHVRAMIKTNRDLLTMYETEDKPGRMAALAEMARRIHRTMVTDDVLPIFKQYKLNGAVDETW